MFDQKIKFEIVVTEKQNKLILRWLKRYYLPTHMPFSYFKVDKNNVMKVGLGQGNFCSEAKFVEMCEKFHNYLYIRKISYQSQKNYKNIIYNVRKS